MFQDVISSHDQLSIDDITSPLSAQIFDFCDSQLFQESFNQTSEANTNTTTTTENSNDNNINLQADKDEDNADLSMIFDSHEDFENDIASSIDFSSSSLQYPIIDHLLETTNQDQYGFSSGVQDVHQQPPNILYSEDPLAIPTNSSVFEENVLSSLPSYNLGLNPSSPSASFFGLPAYMANMCTGLLSSGISHESLHLGSEFNKPNDQSMKFQAENGSLFSTESIKHIFNPEDLKKELGTIENQSLGPVEITGLEDSTLNKVGKLSPEQRKEKIHRYMKKRNERNFSKKIKYACRKTLADSRPRVRGRFAKNDEFCEPNKQASSSHHHHDVEYENMGMKEEEQFSDIFSQINGANSFKFNYTIQSWI